MPCCSCRFEGVLVANAQKNLNKVCEGLPPHYVKENFDMSVYGNYIDIVSVWRKLNS